MVQDPVTEISLTIVRSGNDAVISWPQTCTHYILQESMDLNLPIIWQNSLAVVVPVAGNRYQASVLATGNKFYRLKKQ